MQNRSKTVLMTALAAIVMCATTTAQQPPAPKSVTVFYLKHADAKAVAKTIMALYADNGKAKTVRVVEDARTNALFVTAPAASLKEIENLVKILDAPATKPKQDQPTDEVKIFSLKNAIAANIAKDVWRLVGDVNVVANARTNSLVVTGSKEQLKQMEMLLLQLDSEKGNATETVRVYQLKNVASDRVAKSLTQLQVDGNIASDAALNRLIVKANTRTHTQVSDYLRILDVPEQHAPAKQLRMKVVWLVENKIAGKDSALPPKSLDKVVKVLDAKLGLKELKLAAQTLITLDPDEKSTDSKFESRGTAEILGNTSVDFSVQGQLTGRKGASSVVNFEIHTGSRAMPGRRAAPVADAAETLIATKVVLPRGHFVVLGSTTIRGANSVFVLQILDDD